MNKRSLICALTSIQSLTPHADFNSSETDSKAEPVLYDALAQKHIDAWDDRDKRLVSYAVQQERGRLAEVRDKPPI